MRETTRARAVVLLSAASVAGTPSILQAELEPGVTEIVLTAEVNDGVNLFDKIETLHTFGTVDIDVPAILQPWLTIDIKSDLSDHVAWDYELELDWRDFGLPSPLSFPFVDVQLDIDDTATTLEPITEFIVKNGNDQIIDLDFAFTDGDSIIFTAPTDPIVAGNDVLVVQWNQVLVPAPGAIGLLALGWLVPRRRRG